MRFDDRLQTVLLADPPAGPGAVAQYLQLVDLVGQSREIAPEDVARALARIHELRGIVRAEDRLSAIRAMQGRLVSLALVQYFASERSDIAVAAIRAAFLSEEDWLVLIPKLSVSARGALRHRRDLGPAAERVLASYGAGDLALPDMNGARRGSGSDTPADNGPEAITSENVTGLTEGRAMLDRATTSIEPEQQNIGDIVKRIERLRETRAPQAGTRTSESTDGEGRWGVLRPVGGSSTPELPFEEDLAAGLFPRRFGFRTDVQGDLVSADHVPLGAVYGIRLATPAASGSPGTDAAVASAFQRRMPIRAGRLRLSGNDALAGDWRVDAEPIFERASGRFSGYSGIIRRPRPGEDASLDERHALLGSDGLRQILHELRTPLGAIAGFAEIIEQQLLGPVGADYRRLASTISRDARQLASGFDDLDTALKLDRGVLEDPEGECRTDWLVARIGERLERMVGDDGPDVTLKVDRDLTGFAVSPVAAERVALRFIAALVSIAEPGETLTVNLSQTAGDRGMISVDRPSILNGVRRRDLLDPEFVGHRGNASAPLLGLGFSLRLVRNLAISHGGSLDLDIDTLGLTLPTIGHSEVLGRSGSVE